MTAPVTGSSDNRASRWMPIWLIAPLLLAVMTAGMYLAALQDSIVWDEAAHFPHGYAYWRTGNMWYDEVHASLPRLLTGAPLLALDPRVPTEHASWRTYDFASFRRITIFRNRVQPDSMVVRSRLPAMAMALLLGLTLALWTRAHFGSSAALVALVLYAFHPQFLAFGHLDTSDIFVTAMLFFAATAWASYLERKRLRDLLLAALVIGVAFATKYSLTILVIVLPMIYLLCTIQRPAEYPVRRLALALVVIAVVSVTVVGAVYWPVTSSVLSGGSVPMTERVEPSFPAGRAIHWIAQTLHLPAHPYLMGFYWIAKTNEDGTPAYLMGQTSLHGWWHYFPVAFLVKSPLSFLGALVASLGALAGYLARRDSGFRWRRMPVAWIVVAVTPALYIAMCLFSSINSGSRHLLPVYPFLFALAGGVLGAKIESRGLARIRAVAVTVVVLMSIAESYLAYPHFLAFFNRAAGGTAVGREYLVDSDLDWGQDLKRLAGYLEREGKRPICLAYFGTGDPAYYGIDSQPLPTRIDSGQQPPNCLAAISVTYQAGLYTAPGSFDWLRDYSPVARIGSSINVYDLRRLPGRTE